MTNAQETIFAGIAQALKDAAVEEYEYKRDELKAYPTPNPEQDKYFMMGIEYALSCIVMRMTGDAYDVAKDAAARK